MRLLTLADVTRKWAQPYGIEVIEEGGWQSRGKDFPAAGPDIALRHWTVGPATGIWPSGKVLIWGRSDLPGPLCQLSQDRRSPERLDAIHVVAAGIANHAGLGDWNGTAGGNSVTVGLEIEWSGPNEGFSDKRILVSEIAMRALMDFCGKNPDDACEHREWANPPGRKIDTNLDGNVMRRRMRELASDIVVPTPTPTPTPTPIPEDDEMKPFLARLSNHVEVYLVRGDWSSKWHITQQATLDALYAVMAFNGVPYNIQVFDENSVDPIQQGLCELIREIPQLPHGADFWNDHRLGERVEKKVDDLLKAGGGTVDVDEEALAAALAPLLANTVGKVSNEDLVKIAKAVNDEEARRMVG